MQGGGKGGGRGIESGWKWGRRGGSVVTAYSNYYLDNNYTTCNIFFMTFQTFILSLPMRRKKHYEVYYMIKKNK